jgi:dolichol-phosphate mannosyltransferase
VQRPLVVIPTYNEKENIEAIVRKVFSLDEPLEVLVVDDGSPDGTALIVKDLQQNFSGLHLLERTAKEGLGRAYLAAFAWALERDFTHIFEMDADFSHNPQDLPRLYSAALEGADVVVGSRYVTGVNVVNWPMSRVLLSYFASRYVRMLTGIPVHDTTAGFVCYRREVLEALINRGRIRFVGYAFQIEMKFKAWKMGYSLKEVPVIFTDRQAGKSKMSQKIIREAVFGVLELELGSIFRPLKHKDKV